MRVLVTAGSKYGATAEIARAIGDRLSSRGLDVTVTPVEQAGSVDAYDAVVVGSAVYAGRWTKPAAEFVERNVQLLRTRPVWLFSSGPVGDPPKPETVPVASQLLEVTAARDHKLFAGKIDRRRLNLAEKALVMALHAPEGDFRDWQEIERWTDSIGTALADGDG